MAWLWCNSSLPSSRVESTKEHSEKFVWIWYGQGPILPKALSSRRDSHLCLHSAFSCALHSALLVFRERCYHGNSYNRWYLITVQATEEIDNSTSSEVCIFVSMRPCQTLITIEIWAFPFVSLYIFQADLELAICTWLSLKSQICPCFCLLSTGLQDLSTETVTHTAMEVALQTWCAGTVENLFKLEVMADCEKGLLTVEAVLHSSVFKWDSGEGILAFVCSFLLPCPSDSHLLCLGHMVALLLGFQPQPMLPTGAIQSSWPISMATITKAFSPIPSPLRQYWNVRLHTDLFSFS